MELKFNNILMALGLISGLLLGTGQTGGGVTIAVCATAIAWLWRTDRLRGDGA